MNSDNTNSTCHRIVLTDLDATNHINLHGLVSDSIFNPKIASEFLRQNGIHATGESEDAISVTVVDQAALEDVRFALVCYIATLSYELESIVWCAKARMHNTKSTTTTDQNPG